MGIMGFLWHRHYNIVRASRDFVAKEYKNILDEAKLLQKEVSILNKIKKDMRSGPQGFNFRNVIDNIIGILDDARLHCNKLKNIMIDQDKVLKDMHRLMVDIEKGENRRDKIKVFLQLRQDFEKFKEEHNLEYIELETKLYDDVNYASHQINNLKNYRWITADFNDLFKYIKKIQKMIRILKDIIRHETKMVYQISARIDNIYEKEIKAIQTEHERQQSEKEKKKNEQKRQKLRSMFKKRRLVYNH